MMRLTSLLSPHLVFDRVERVTFKHSYSQIAAPSPGLQPAAGSLQAKDGNSTGVSDLPGGTPGGLGSRMDVQCRNRRIPQPATKASV
jgi:hypothetical protein